MIKGQKGLSLVEVTIMLLVLMLLTSVLAPSIWDFVHDAQWVKVKEDCEAIGISVSRLVRDVGPCLKVVGTADCTNTNRVDVLVSIGSEAVVDTTSAPAYTPLNSNIVSTNWSSTSNRDTMDNQLITNGAGYNTPYINYSSTGSYPVGPLFGLGWRGAYLAPPVGPDPWGTKYYVNSGFMATSTTTASANNEGNKKWWWEHDVICLTPGPNQTIETPFAGSTNRGTDRQNDDFVFVISGSGR
jgi:hypothetical protein